MLVIYDESWDWRTFQDLCQEVATQVSRQGIDVFHATRKVSAVSKIIRRPPFF